jgi:hypothetical protein
MIARLLRRLTMAAPPDKLPLLSGRAILYYGSLAAFDWGKDGSLIQPRQAPAANTNLPLTAQTILSPTGAET